MEVRYDFLPRHARHCAAQLRLFPLVALPLYFAVMVPAEFGKQANEIMFHHPCLEHVFGDLKAGRHDLGYSSNILYGRDVPSGSAWAIQ